jgi:tetratricopeptide (TPR) repeat protein
VDILGKQLVDEKYSVAEYGDDLDAALQPIMQVLQTQRTLLVIDNMESLLADVGNTEPVLALADKLLKSFTQTRLLFTTREPLPAPFNHKACDIELDTLSVTDAKALVMQVMNNEGLNLRHDDQGKTPEEVDDLVRSVSCHARALVLLARELAQLGVTATTANLHQIMQELDAKNPRNRENSLFASMELSLRRLSPEVSRHIVGFSVFYDGGHIANLAHVVGVNIEVARQVATQLIQIGLAKEKSHAYLRLHPTLPFYISLSSTHEQQSHYRQRWVEAMGQLVGLLYQQSFQNTVLSTQLTQLELPNLMKYLYNQVLALGIRQVTVEHFAEKARKVEELLANINQPQALQQVVIWRQQAMQHLGEWSNTNFQNERMNIERMLQQKALQQALTAAQTLLQQSQQEGEQSYQNADYNLAMAHFLLGRVLKISGFAEQALPYLRQAQQRFEQVGKQGAGMASVAITEQGDCLRTLGKLDTAAATYNEAIRRTEKRADTRGLATNKNQLATTHMLQKRYTDALHGYQETLHLFQKLDEPAAVATIWHQMGMLHRQIGNYSQAEQAYRQSLSIASQQSNRAGEAGSLGELGTLYDEWKRPEQALVFYQQAANIYMQLGDLRYEGITRSNIANTLIQLMRYDEAHIELQQAIECGQAFGYAAEPWKSWDILHDLEQASGNIQAAYEARQQALAAFLAYRWDGGENHSDAGCLALAVGLSIQQGDTAKAQQLLDAELADDSWKEYKNFLHKLQAIIAGERDLTLAEDDGLPYELVAELVLLLEKLREAGI